ncbi:hypothetical protein GUJ93_ZPchr0005g14347 [Zizania palustris]|uniref:Uncharacterized protein n=1 Tax=Zizania palustris TaxID=103762 RepID=A0A8J5VR20_ZIZPA|nr:hypothetical protein GUJ93_ZPchr0005g14347 [Zizania palustris]
MRQPSPSPSSGPAMGNVGVARSRHGGHDDAPVPAGIYLLRGDIAGRFPVALQRAADCMRDRAMMHEDAAEQLRPAAAGVA